MPSVSGRHSRRTIKWHLIMNQHLLPCLLHRQCQTTLKQSAIRLLAIPQKKGPSIGQNHYAGTPHPYQTVCLLSLTHPIKMPWHSTKIPVPTFRHFLIPAGRNTATALSAIRDCLQHWISWIRYPPMKIPEPLTFPCFGRCMVLSWNHSNLQVNWNMEK